MWDAIGVAVHPEWWIPGAAVILTALVALMVLADRMEREDHPDSDDGDMDDTEQQDPTGRWAS